MYFLILGCKTKRIKYTGQTLLNVRMDSDTKSIDQVEVTARRIERNDMGITNKEMVSATQKVKMDDLGQLPRLYLWKMLFRDS